MIVGRENKSVIAAPNNGFKKTLVGAALLFFVDAIWMNQGGISAILGLAILFVAIPMAFFGCERTLRAYK